ncbi:PIN domain-containing protein [Methylobacterium sp. 17Sr1-1]|uniref:PIN domain-containing protein n=1 Tax=Methylobacterium sp. 17Sr1-1 TaxID=2202826 RepID=UPI001FE09398|nr:PIN domain-containing protein [Methylobacterium sp. 17Sr1-1]
MPESVAARLREEAGRLYLSAVTIAEIREGVCKLRRKSATARADTFDAWLSSLLDVFGDRVLPFGIGEAEATGTLGDSAVGIGRHPGFADIAIAATAKVHGLVLVTENLRHFEPLQAFGVAMHNLSGIAQPNHCLQTDRSRNRLGGAWQNPGVILAYGRG